MELAVILLLLIAFSHAQEGELELKFENASPRNVPPGTQITFLCHINQNLLFVVNNNIKMIRKSAIDGSEVVLSQMAQLSRKEDQEFYSVTVQPTDSTTIYKFDILKVRDIDEGSLICRMDSAEPAQAEVHINILRPLDSLHLQFDNFDAISRDKNEPIEIDVGRHTVKCIASGSNPPPRRVKLYLNGNEITNVQNNTERIEADVIKHRTTITGTVDLTVSHSKQAFECRASSDLGDNHSVRLPIKIKIYDAKISCNDSEAFLGKKYPKLACLVDYEGLSVKSIGYNLGDERVVEGTQNSDFVEVQRQQLSDHKAIVSLNLYRAEDWHFKQEFYIEVEHEDGHITRESVRLREIPGDNTDEQLHEDPGDKGSFLAASLLLVMASLCWSLHSTL